MRAKREIARDAILSAGSLLRESFGREIGGRVEEKDRNDFVTEADRQSERMITRTLSRAFPQIGFLAEEGGGSPAGDSYWVIDPLDGTTNFIHGYPSIGVSIALVERGEVGLGLVYDPLREELFEAESGGGSYCNGARIKVSSIGSLSEALLGTGFPFRIHGYVDVYLELFKRLFLSCRGIRRAGAAALDLAYVASGRLDGFFELALKPWDVAAGGLLIREAGGVVTDFFGGPGFMTGGTIAAGNAAVHGAVVEATSLVFDPDGVAEFSTEIRAERP